MTSKYKIDRSPRFDIFNYALYEQRSFFGLWYYWKVVRRSDYIDLLEDEYKKTSKIPIYLPDDINDDPVNFEIIECLDLIYIVSKDRKEHVEKLIDESCFTEVVRYCDFVLKRYNYKTKNNIIFYQMIKNRKTNITELTFKNMREVEKFVKEYYDKEILK